MKYAYFTRFCITMPSQAVSDCHHQGACDDDVAFWEPKIPVFACDTDIIDELLEYGAWERKELESLSTEELREKIIWLAAGNIQEEEK